MICFINESQTPIQGEDIPRITSFLFLTLILPNVLALTTILSMVILCLLDSVMI